MRKSEILDRIIKHYGLKNKTGLASFLGVSPQTVSNWYSRDSIDYDLIFEKCTGVDFNWLVAGDSYGYKDNTGSDPVASDNRGVYEVPVVRNRIIPVVTMEDGIVSGDDSSTILHTGESVAVPENMLSGGDYIAYKTDESMKPSFPSGDYVVCKRIVDLGAYKFLSSSTYAVAVLGGKLLLRRAFLEKSQPNRIIFRADNPNKFLYPDIEVNVKDIKEAWEVKLSLSQPESCACEMEKRLGRLEAGFSDIQKMVEFIITKVEQ